MEYLVNVCNAICGMGKTSAAINMINESDLDEKFIYITPFLTEVDRIVRECKYKKFRQPEKKKNTKTKKETTKMSDMKYLITKGYNIASSHSLFLRFNQNIIDLAKLNNYTLILDEVADVVNKYNISNDDLRTILDTEKYAHIEEESGLVIWDKEDYTGEFDKVKALCDLKCLTAYGKNRDIFIWNFPVSVFQAFKKIYILTYLFEAQPQKYYYDYYNVKYNYIYIKNDNIPGEEVNPKKFHFTEEKRSYDISIYKNLIDILNKENFNIIGEEPTSLCKNWFYHGVNDGKVNILQKKVYNFFHNETKTKTKFNLWTTYKSYAIDLEGKGYKGGFVPLNIMATNDYIETTAVAYLANIYFDPNIKGFFVNHNIEVNEDLFALSELIQFLFRSAIRKKEKITLYIPSKRMRTLLIRWLDEEFN